jgi:hypothetical protein
MMLIFKRYQKQSIVADKKPLAYYGQSLPPTNKRPETSNLGKGIYMPKNSSLPAMRLMLTLKFLQKLQETVSNFYKSTYVAGVAKHRLARKPRYLLVQGFCVLFFNV